MEPEKVMELESLKVSIDASPMESLLGAIHRAPLTVAVRAKVAELVAFMRAGEGVVAVAVESEPGAERLVIAPTVQLRGYVQAVLDVAQSGSEKPGAGSSVLSATLVNSWQRSMAAALSAECFASRSEPRP